MTEPKDKGKSLEKQNTKTGNKQTWKIKNTLCFHLKTNELLIFFGFIDIYYFIDIFLSNSFMNNVNSIKSVGNLKCCFCVS